MDRNFYGRKNRAGAFPPSAVQGLIYDINKGCVHKLAPGNPGYDPAVHKLITETVSSTLYERLVLYLGHAPNDPARE